MDLDSKPDNFLSEEKDDNVIKFDGAAPVDSDSQPAPEKPKKRHAMRRFLWWCVAVVVISLGVVTWISYVVDFKRQGVLFKAWEGQMFVRSALIDSTRPYSRDFVFSVDNEDVADRLASAKGTGRKVTVSYKRYWGVLPWRGATPVIVTSVR